jgi:hypothetical protein
MRERFGGKCYDETLNFSKREKRGWTDLNMARPYIVLRACDI